MVIGAADPVLGQAVMHHLQQDIRGCPPPVVLPQAGHFVPEHGRQIAFGDTQRVTAVYERFLNKELSLEEAKQLFAEQDASVG